MTDLETQFARTVFWRTATCCFAIILAIILIMI